MAGKILKKGIIKIVWIGRDLSKTYSKMFANIENAKKFARGKEDYLIFKLLKKRAEREFIWEVLPYGRYKIYQRAINLYKKNKDKILSVISKLI